MWDDVVALVDEVRRTHNALVMAASELHSESGIGVPLRAVLEFLGRHGPTAVPEIARSRNVSRQHVQTLVNELEQLGLIEYLPNPGHRRSHLAALTQEGSRTIVAMQRREEVVFGALLENLSAGEFQAAAATLRDVRLAIDKELEGTFE